MAEERWCLMTSDNERREVARKLRETGEELGSSVLLWYHIAKILGVRTATDGKTACDMLADLIEPGEQKVRCVAEVKVDGEQLEKLAHDASAELTGIDRDALMAVAETLEDCAGRGSDLTALGYSCLAKRIREALGVEHG